MALTFGKHKGVDITEVPTGYLRWCLDTLHPQAFHDSLVQVKAELARRGIIPPPRPPAPKPVLNKPSRDFNAREARRPNPPDVTHPQLRMIPPWEPVPAHLRHLVPVEDLYD